MIKAYNSQSGQKPSVCLIRPPTFASVNSVGQDATPPIGLAYLASSIMQAGYPTSAIDAVGESIHQYTMLDGCGGQSLLHGLTNEEVVNRIPEDTAVIGMACMFSVEWSFQQPLLNDIRKRFPNALIVVGGEHVTACPEYILESTPSVDLCILGEGEETFIELLDQYSEGKTDFHQVLGMCVRHNGEFYRTGKRKRIAEVDEIPEPNWDIFPIEEYIDNAMTHGANLGRCMPIMASRGCPYACTFCSSAFMWTQKWNVRDPQKVIDEMKKYIKKYNIENFDFYDLTAIIRKEWVIEFCGLLKKEKLNITWQLPSGTRSEAIDDEVCQLLYESGCRHMSYAPESGSPEELKRIKKKVNLDKMIESMKSAKRANVQVKCNFIFAMPGQTWGDVFKTWKFITRLAIIGVEDISAFPYSPYPGTELYSDLEKIGKVKMDEAYFKSLSGFTDFSRGTCYNDTFHPTVVGWINIFTMSYFYILAHICHPSRIYASVKAFFTKDTSTRFFISYSHVLRKTKAAQKSKKEGQKTVFIDPVIKPKSQAKALNH